MKTAIILGIFGCIAAAHGGIGRLTAKQEKEILDLWLTYCDTDHPHPPPGLHCKPSEDQLEQVVNHQVIVPDTGKLGEQIVYVRPPPIKYTHNVQIQGGDGAAPKTKIYVLPQKAEHELKSEYIPGDLNTEKPSVYFLKSDGKEELHPVRYGGVQTGRAGYRSG